MFFEEPETWVAVAFLIMIGGFGWLGVHRTVLTALDHRAERIKAELDDAMRLKQEAAKVLAEYNNRRASAEREAEEIIANAKFAREPRLFLLPRRLRLLGRHELRIEADIEDVMVRDVGGRRGIDDIVGYQRKRHAFLLTHGHRRAVGLGHDHFLADAALHHSDA